MKALRIPYIGTTRFVLLCALLTGCATVTRAAPRPRNRRDL